MNRSEQTNILPIAVYSVVQIYFYAIMFSDNYYWLLIGSLEFYRRCFPTDVGGNIERVMFFTVFPTALAVSVHSAAISPSAT